MRSAILCALLGACSSGAPLHVSDDGGAVDAPLEVPETPDDAAAGPSPDVAPEPIDSPVPPQECLQEWQTCIGTDLRCCDGLICVQMEATGTVACVIDCTDDPTVCGDCQRCAFGRELRYKYCVPQYDTPDGCEPPDET